MFETISNILFIIFGTCGSTIMIVATIKLIKEFLNG